MVPRRHRLHEVGMLQPLPSGDVESNPGPRTHTNKDIPAIWLICNNTQDTLGSCELHTDEQRQYKHDWRCTIYTPTYNVTPSTDNTTAHHKNTLPSSHKQQSTKGQTHRHTSNQHKRHQIQNLKTSHTAANRTSSQYKKQNSHRKRNHQKYPTTPPYA